MGKVVYVLARMTKFSIFHTKHLQLDTWNWLFHNDILHSKWGGRPSNKLFGIEHHLTGCPWHGSVPPDNPSQVTFWGHSLSPLMATWSLLDWPNLKSLIPIGWIMAGYLSPWTLRSLSQDGNKSPGYLQRSDVINRSLSLFQSDGDSLLRVLLLLFSYS